MKSILSESIVAILVLITSNAYAMTAEQAEHASQTMQNNQPQTKVEDPSCRAAWSSSSAAQSCTTLDYIEQSPPGTCAIHARCLGLSTQTRNLPDWKTSVPAASWQYDQKVQVTQFFPASQSYTNQLVNCDGQLKYFNCQ